MLGLDRPTEDPLGAVARDLERLLLGHRPGHDLAQLAASAGRWIVGSLNLWPPAQPPQQATAGEAVASALVPARSGRRQEGLRDLPEYRQRLAFRACAVSVG